MDNLFVIHIVEALVVEIGILIHESLIISLQLCAKVLEWWLIVNGVLNWILLVGCIFLWLLNIINCVLWIDLIIRNGIMLGWDTVLMIGDRILILRLGIYNIVSDRVCIRVINRTSLSIYGLIITLEACIIISSSI